MMVNKNLFEIRKEIPHVYVLENSQIKSAHLSRLLEIFALLS